MAVICPNCKSHDTQAELNTWFCMMCGKRTPMADIASPQPAEPDPEKQ